MPILAFLRLFCHRSTLRRTFMSAAFSCNDAWESRLSAPIFQNLEMNKFYFDIERKFQREGRGSPIDADIFANAILMPKEGRKELKAETVRDRLDQLEDILRRFRRTPQTNMAQESMSHAVIRAYVDTGHEVSLMRILAGREEFGVFPDDHSAVYMLNEFLTKGNFRDASKVAIESMLQEEFDVEIASQMSVFAAYNYALSLPDVTDDGWNPKLPSDPEEKNLASSDDDDEEEVKIRVWFVDNDYFDEHFDLKDRHHLLGKTLAKFAEHGGVRNLTESPESEDVKFSLKMLGYSLFQKWENVVEVCNDWRSKRVDRQCLDLARQYALSLPDGKNHDADAKGKAVTCIEELKVADGLDVGSYLKSEVQKSVEMFESKYIQQLTDIYRRWTDGREQALKDQYDMYVRETRLEKLKQAKKDMADQEERLFFFDNYENLEKMKREKFVNWRKKWPRKTGIKMPVKEEVKDDYVPPEVGRRRRD